MNTDVELDRVSVLPVQAALVVPVFACALFTSAMLLFWVQPLVAKMLLPLLGGVPAVWNTCMVFFQALLLAGYAYALLISKRLSLRNQAIVHALLLLGATLVLPFALSSRLVTSLPTQTSPILWLLTALLITVGPPFFLLSATAPLLQRWFSHSSHKSAHDPYSLYAISNAGSVLALLGFPFLLEPAFTVRTQSVIWAAGYGCLVLLIVASAVVVRRVTPAHAEIAVEQVVEHVGAAKRLEWTVLALIPSSLMLGVTTFIATDIASVPLIWIIPLALYLSTFILAFARKQIIKPALASILFPAATLVLAAVIALKAPISIWVLIALHLLVFFLAALVCHQRLVLSRPHVSKLPEYYLWIAVGGVLGGAFNALLAPLIFSTPVEYPVAIILALLMRPVTPQEKTTAMWFRIVFPLFILAITFNLSSIAPRLGFSGRAENFVMLAPLALCLAFSFRRPIVFGLALAAFMSGITLKLNARTQTLTTERNFFGVWRVTAKPNEELRYLHHGSTVHGVQLTNASRECEATSYYHKDGPVGQVVAVHNSKPTNMPVAVTGLGAGTMATYSAPGQQWDFYDIDPSIVRIASDPRLFTFLSNCTKGSYRVILGDARLKLRDAPQGHYGLIVMDAFSSDSVPAHLLTTQALELYLAKLAPDGMIAFHISNRYLRLEPLLAGLSRRAGLSAFLGRDNQPGVNEKFPSLWVVMARNDAALGTIPNDSRWTKLQGDVVWTDDFSNILSLLE